MLCHSLCRIKGLAWQSNSLHWSKSGQTRNIVCFQTNPCLRTVSKGSGRTQAVNSQPVDSWLPLLRANRGDRPNQAGVVSESKSSASVDASACWRGAEPPRHRLNVCCSDHSKPYESHQRSANHEPLAISEFGCKYDLFRPCQRHKFRLIN